MDQTLIAAIADDSLAKQAQRGNEWPTEQGNEQGNASGYGIEVNTTYPSLMCLGLFCLSWTFGYLTVT